MRSPHLQLLCVTSGPVHPSLMARAALIAWVRRLPRTRAHVVHDIERILEVRLERFASVLLYLHATHISDDALAALDTYVSEGGGLVAIHSAAASFDDTASYSAILGGRFVRHGPIASFSIRQSRRSGDFAGGGPAAERRTEKNGHEEFLSLAPSFPPTKPFTVRDELYVHEYDPDNYVHFVVDTEDGPQPAAWSRLHGRGRVFYLAPGHRTETLRHPAIRGILRHGIRWAMNADTPG